MSDPVRMAISLNDYKTAMWYWLDYDPLTEKYTAYRDSEPTFKFTSKYLANVRSRVTRKFLRSEEIRNK